MNQLKNQSGFALPIAILIVVVLVVAGGTGYYFYLSRDEVLRDKTSSQELEEIEIYPGAVEVKVPPNLAEEIRGDLSPGVKIKVYSSWDSAEKIQNWYKSHLSDKGWEKIWNGIKEEGEFGFMLWKKGRTGFSVGLNLTPDVKGGTSILLVKDKFEAWEEILKILGEQEKDVPACDKEATQKDKDYCYLNLAISIQDASFCDKIIDVDATHNCYIKVAIASNDTSICEKEEYQVFEDFCYQSIAIFNRDASVCEKIANPTYCYSRVAAITNNISLCRELPDQKNRDDCYYKVALFTENLSPCEEIIDKTSKDTCYQKVGMASGDISFCEKEEDQLVKDTCYYKMAVQTQNASLCGKIIYEVTKNSCYDSLGIKDHEGYTWTAEGQRDGRRVSDLTNIRMAIELYYEDFLSFPVLADTSQDGEFLKVLVDEGFMTKVVPLDPQHPEHYYEYNGTRESYMLKCYIEEGGGINDMRDGVKDHAYTITFPLTEK